MFLKLEMVICLLSQRLQPFGHSMWFQNFTYLRYDAMIPDVIKIQKNLEDKFAAYTPSVDLAAQNLWNAGIKKVRLFNS